MNVGDELISVNGTQYIPGLQSRDSTSGQVLPDAEGRLVLRVRRISSGCEEQVVWIKSLYAVIVCYVYLGGATSE